MGTDWQQEVSAAFSEARSVFGVAFTVAGDSKTYYGVQRDTSTLLPLGSGGFVEDFDGTMDYNNAEVDPDVGEEITIGSTTYRVGHKVTSLEDTVGVLYLIGVSK